uniref:Ribosomal protein S11 n=1 Tax=Protohalopteris sp. TaxID=2843287 RepID=A0A8F0FDI2_9PHAE|nr:ribosomal protein S11 [Protohalopteris sp.]
MIKKSKMLKNKNTFNVVHKIGILYIISTKRNVKCAFVDPNEKKVKTSCSLGVIKVDNKSLMTEYERANEMGLLMAQKIQDFKYTKISIFLRGLGLNRKAIVKGLECSGFIIDKLMDMTLSPHNGCRLAKVRRKKFRTKVSYKNVNKIGGM